MMTSSNWNIFPRYWTCVRGIHCTQVNCPHKGQSRRTLIFSLISAWINGWVNNAEAGDLRRHRAHYHGIVMYSVKANHKKNGRRLSDLDNKAFDSEVFINDLLGLHIEMFFTLMLFNYIITVARCGGTRWTINIVSNIISFIFQC